MSFTSLSNIIKIVWIEKTISSKSSLKKKFLIQKHKIYDILQWLIHNHENYQENVTIDQFILN